MAVHGCNLSSARGSDEQRVPVTQHARTNVVSPKWRLMKTTELRRHHA